MKRLVLSMIVGVMPTAAHATENPKAVAQNPLYNKMCDLDHIRFDYGKTLRRYWTSAC
jgi:hypothetical protein